MANDFPEIRDTSTLTGVFNTDQFMVVGVEGRKEAGGSATVGVPVVVSDPADADTLFGSGSSLATLVKFVLGRGLNYVWAVASKSAAAPLLADRIAAWVSLEENPDVRVRLTDSTTQADLVALADSCEYAELIQHKQFAVVGLALPTTKANLSTAAAAIASKRGVIVGPGVYDLNGNLLSGAYAAAYAACEVAKNPDIADSLNDTIIPATAGIETDPTTGMPLFRLKANAGSPINDFQDLLDDGVSPLKQGRSGQAEFTHLRTTYTVDDTYDALMTLLIKDEVFLQLKSLLLDAYFLRHGNTAVNRGLAAKLVDNWLRTHADWVQPIDLPDGTLGYGVAVTASPDKKTMTVSYNGEVVRGTNVININGVLTIPV